MIALLRITFLWLCLAKEFNGSDTIGCTKKLEYLVKEDNYYANRLRDHEEQIGTLGHWNGFKPSQYNLKLDFHNSSHYTGSVEILGVIVQETDTLAVNIDNKYISYNQSSISVYCSGSVHSRLICIEKATHYTGFDYILLGLNVKLLPGEKCGIAIPQFQSYARKDSGQISAIGLRITVLNYSPTVTTNFKMRYARTVFPCMDHPALRARFNLSLVYNWYWTAVSNSQENIELNVRVNKYSYSYFELTSRIPTNMFGFALLQDQHLSTTPIADSFRQYARFADEGQLEWIRKFLYEERTESNIMLQVPTFNISYVVLDGPLPEPSIVSYGLILLDFNSVGIKSADVVTKKLLVYDAILRQYLGGVVTVSNWNEICLLEGLVQYFKSVLKASLLKAEGKEMKHETLEDACITNQWSLTGHRLAPMWDTYRCDKRAGLFFQGLSNTFGHSTVLSLFNSVIHEYSFGSAGLKVWDNVLARIVTQTAFARNIQHGSVPLNGYIEHFFQQTEPNAMFINYNPYSYSQERKISFRGDVSYKLPMPLNMYMSGQTAKKIMILHKDNQPDGFGPHASWTLIDSDGDTCTIKYYSEETYFALFKAKRDDRFRYVNDQRMSNLVQNFCYALMKNWLEYGERKLSSNWRRALDFAYKLKPTCRCCLVRRKVATNCTKEQFAECDKVSINKLL